MRVANLTPLLIKHRRNRELCIALEAWTDRISQVEAENINQLREVFNRYVDLVSGTPDLLVFNVRGNKYRLIVVARFEEGVLILKEALTHAEYSKINWANLEYIQQRFEL